MNVFVDTNVLVYARDTTEPDKQRVARIWLDQLWGEMSGRTSVQVLNEYYVTATRKLSHGLDRVDVLADVRDLKKWDPVTLTPTLMEIAWGIEDRFGFSWWDSLVVAAAQLVDADFLLTEDLQDGQDLDGVVVMNPFLHDPAAIGY